MQKIAIKRRIATAIPFEPHTPKHEKSLTTTSLVFCPNLAADAHILTSPAHAPCVPVAAEVEMSIIYG